MAIGLGSCHYSILRTTTPEEGSRPRHGGQEEGACTELNYDHSRFIIAGFDYFPSPHLISKRAATKDFLEDVG